MQNCLKRAVSALLPVCIAASSLTPAFAVADAGAAAQVSPAPPTLLTEQTMIDSVERLHRIPPDAGAPANLPKAPPLSDEKLSLDEIEARLKNDSPPQYLQAGDGKVFPGSETASILFATMIIAGIQLVREANDNARLHGETLNKDQYWGLFKKMAGTILVSEDLWLGVGGAKLTEPLVRILHAWASDPIAGGLARKVFASGMAQLVTMVSWTFMSQLWREAVEQQPAAQQKAALGVAFRVFEQLESPNVAISELMKSPDYKLLLSILRSMEDILWRNPTLRDELVADAFRLQLENGKTVLFTLAIVTGSVIGTVGVAPLALPTAATWLICVGLNVAGGIAVSYAPEWLTDDITNSLRSARIYFDNQRLITNEKELRNAIDRLQFSMRFKDARSAQIHERVLAQLPARMDIRRDVMTAIMEKYYDLSVKVQKAEHDIKIAETVIEHKAELNKIQVWKDGKFIPLEQAMAKPAVPGTAYQMQRLQEAEAVVANAHHTLDGFAKQALGVYAHEVHLFDHHLNNSQELLTPDISTALNGELKWTCVTGRILGDLFGFMDPKAISELHLDRLDSTLTQMAKKPEMRAVAMDHINYIYLHRFNEPTFLNAFQIDRQVLAQYPVDFDKSCVGIANQFEPQPQYW